jgi:hypothetical protein
MKHRAQPAVDAISLVPWPLLRIARNLTRRPAPPDLLLFFAEALEEAAAHAQATSAGTNPCAQGLRDLAADVRTGVPIRDDTNPVQEAADDQLRD